MGKIKVGELVRTVFGDIYKVENLKNYEFLRDKFYNYIVKHSKNIIDLVELGDYVNGRLVLQVDYKNKNVCLLIPLTDTKANTNIMWYGYEDIRTVVTKEMMKSVEYRVETD